MSRDWTPTLGAWLEPGGVRFRVWAPEAHAVRVVFEPPRPEATPLERFSDGTFGGEVADARAGDRYRYEIDGRAAFPDPASRFQPNGVHGPSAIVDPRSFRWTDGAWSGVEREALVLYELHVGTFTPEGTFAAAAERLPHVARLGVTAIELMPVADFPGGRNWGYDGVNPFAPARCYGSPDDLRRLVDRAHALGLAVFLDVVYNHLGPEGNYLPQFSPYYLSATHTSPWGQGMNVDGAQSAMVRQYFIENALHWVHEYHLDGLRLDATHAIVDDSPRPFVAELAARVKASADRPVHVIAEDHRNLASMVRPEGEGGWGLDGVWADDFHHQIRVALAGDTDGYYRDYRGSTDDLAATLTQGWFFTGQYSSHLEGPRGTDPEGVPAARFVICLQNHDQIGNRALGERLHHQIDLAAYRAATALLLAAPQTPLLFMGQEWAASAPFLYFTDHPDELGRRVTEGRRNEFRHFAAFAEGASRARIPDPQAPATWASSRLDWTEASREPHASMLRLYRALLAQRRCAGPARRGRFAASALTERTLQLRQDMADGPSIVALVHLGGADLVHVPGPAALAGLDLDRWQVILTTEDRPFAPDPQPLAVDGDGGALRVAFPRPSAVLLSIWPAA